MAVHAFGGDWTTDKLERLGKYLSAYTTIFAKNPKAQYFTTTFVDAFAGTGARTRRSKGSTKPDLWTDDVDPEAENFRKGSARIALEVEPAFHKLIFIERSPTRAMELEKLRDSFPAKAKEVEIDRIDANAFLQRWCKETNWKTHRAVVFLDPYGMQVEWSTIEALAKTEAVDLWLLFPLGVAVNRLLTKAEPPPGDWGNALTRIFGTEDWRPAFYPKKQQGTLFGVEETQRRDATLDSIAQFFLARLETVFPKKVAPNPLPLRNSKGMPIYLLCFAAGNPKGAPTAIKIAQSILKQ
jgi:three-Cys-motif partner protein